MTKTAINLYDSGSFPSAYGAVLLTLIAKHNNNEQNQCSIYHKQLPMAGIMYWGSRIERFYKSLVSMRDLEQEMYDKRIIVTFGINIEDTTVLDDLNDLDDVSAYSFIDCEEEIEHMVDVLRKEGMSIPLCVENAVKDMYESQNNKDDLFSLYRMLGPSRFVEYMMQIYSSGIDRYIVREDDSPAALFVESFNEFGWDTMA